MQSLSRELRELGYEPTDRESPFHEDGMLWTNSYELVCDKTGAVIRKSGGSDESRDSLDEEIHTYQNTEKVKMVGGYVRPYSESDGLY